MDRFLFRQEYTLQRGVATIESKRDQTDCKSLPGLNRTAFPGGMETSSPVLGFLPIPVLRGLIVKTPNPRSSMRSSPFNAAFIASKTVSTASSAFARGMPVLSTTWLIISNLITADLPSTKFRRQSREQVQYCQEVWRPSNKIATWFYNPIRLHFKDCPRSISTSSIWV